MVLRELANKSMAVSSWQHKIKAIGSLILGIIGIIVSIVFFILGDVVYGFVLFFVGIFLLIGAWFAKRRAERLDSVRI